MGTAGQGWSSCRRWASQFPVNTTHCYCIRLLCRPCHVVLAGLGNSISKGVACTLGEAWRLMLGEFAWMWSPISPCSFYYEVGTGSS
jgi:hypothetical protein